MSYPFQVELKDVMVELVDARESLDQKDVVIKSLEESKSEIESRLSSLGEELQEKLAAEPKVVEVIKEVRIYSSFT